MSDYYFTFRSVTTAQRAAQLCAQAGIGSSMMRTPKRMAKHGCGYCLKIAPDQAKAAGELLHGADLPVQGVYQAAADAVTEVFL